MSQRMLPKENGPFSRIYPVSLLHLLQGYLSQILRSVKKQTNKQQKKNPLLLVLPVYFMAHFSDEKSSALQGYSLCVF